MAIQVEQLSPLGRKMSIEVPAEEIGKLIDARMKKLMQTVRIAGFRVGKVPYKVIETRYGNEVFSEVIQEALSNSLKNAFEEEKLQPVATPRIENLQVAPKESLRYEAIFDIYPTIELGDMSKIQVVRKSVRISEEDIDSTIEQLRKREADWNLVDRAAANGDKLFADVTLESGDHPPKDMKRLPVELGSKTMIAGFEDGLLGAKAGDEIILNLTFPDPYFDASLSGKPAKFTIRVLEVLERKLSSDEELLEKLGIEEGMDELRTEVRAHIEKEAEEAIKHELKQDLWNKLLEAHTFDLPKSLIESELHRIIHPNESNEDAHNHDHATSEQQALAARQVRLGLLMSEFVTAHKINLDADRLRATVEKMVSAFQNPSEMANYYYQNKNLLSEIKARVLEDQVIDELLKLVTLIDQDIDYHELLKK